MKKQDFVKAVRQGEAKFRADDIVITTDTEQFRGKGLLEVAQSRFRLHVTLDEGSKVPEAPQGIKVRREFWKIHGMVDDDLGFSLQSLPNSVSHNYTDGQPPKSSVAFSAAHIELTANGFDCMTSREICELQQEFAGISTIAAAEAQPQKAKTTFHAVLPNYKLIERNGGTETKTKNTYLGEICHSSLDTFQGEIGDWECGLVERDGDLHVHFVSKPEHESKGEAHDWRLFHAFLNALAFIHAQHTWPFSVEHRRDGKLIMDRIQLNDDVADSPHAPFDEALAFRNLTQKLGWQYGEALEKAYNFFSSDSKVAREVETLLFIFREATTSGIPKRIALLGLCSLFESLVRVVYEEEVPLKNEDVEFQRAKSEICEVLQKREQAPYERLAAILKGAEPVNNRARYDAVIEHLDLKPQAQWRALFGLWSRFRNPMSHRMAKEAKSDDSMVDELIAESRIAGAINCIVLKLMKYSGYVRLSVYENKYGQI